MTCDLPIRCSWKSDNDGIGQRDGRKARAGQPVVTLATLRRDVQALRDPERARFMQRFFHTGPGQYAGGDRMVGLTVPVQRTIARAYRTLPLADLAALLDSPFHEHRLIALIILIDKHTRAAGEQTRRELHFFYPQLAWREQLGSRNASNGLRGRSKLAVRDDLARLVQKSR